VFARSLDGEAPEIAQISSSGGPVTPLVVGYEPSWSRDGRTVLFSRSNGIFAMNLNDGEVRQLTSGNHRQAAWRK
ncbi:MAG TPA: hypothetical protein VF042_04695, partial [Gemmatimonadaceae bacterium]